MNNTYKTLFILMVETDNMFFTPINKEMRFTKFKIQNYKGIKELILELGKQPKTKIFTLVGLNESGKTSILEAINLFQQDIPKTERHTLIPQRRKNKFYRKYSYTSNSRTVRERQRNNN